MKPKAAKAPAKTRAALLDAIRAEYECLERTVNALSAKQRVQPGIVGEWSVKDVLAHLTAWHGRLLQRVKGEPERGSELGTPASNAQVYQANRRLPLRAVQAEFEASYASVIALAAGLSDRQAEAWWQAFALNTHGHYRWATTHVRRWMKAQAT